MRLPKKKKLDLQFHLDRKFDLGVFMPERLYQNYKNEIVSRKLELP